MCTTTLFLKRTTAALYMLIILKFQFLKMKDESMVEATMRKAVGDKTVKLFFN